LIEPVIVAGAIPGSKLPRFWRMSCAATVSCHSVHAAKTIAVQ
jgi:hypothetical protein